MSQSKISNRLTHLLDANSPVICAPMAGASSGALAGQVSLAGGFGFFGTGYESVDEVREELETAKLILPGEQLRIGVGFIGWLMDTRPDDALEALTLCLEYRVRALWFSFGVDLGRWIQRVRDIEGRQPSSRPTLIFVLVNSVDEAIVASKDWKADVLVVQGIESGGHGSATAPSLHALLPSVLAIIPEDGPVIVGAGGLANGTQIASLLVLGASGAALGTRFLLSPQSRYSESQRAALIAASSESTVRTEALDAVRGTTGWPAGVDGRGLNNLTVQEIEKGEDIAEVKRKFEEAAKIGDANRLVVWAGTGVGLMTEIKPAGEIVQELHADILHSLLQTMKTIE